MKANEDQMKALAVALILDFKPEEAIRVLSRWYRVSEPRLRMGVFEGRTIGVAAVYSQKRKEILVAKQAYLYEPFVIIHEFYHHLRSTSGKHRGTERQADEFASGFLGAYQQAAKDMRMSQAADQMSSSLSS